MTHIELFSNDSGELCFSAHEVKTIRLMKHYVTDGDHKARVHYSHTMLTDGRECVTIYAKDYTGALHKIFDDVEDNTDIMTDYFEKGRVRIYPENPLFEQAMMRCGIRLVNNRPSGWDGMTEREGYC